MSMQFLLTSLIIVVTPGTGVLVTLTAALSHGKSAAIVAALGCTLGIVPHMLAAITGLTAILHASALAYEILRYAGVAYLLYMAVMMFLQRGALSLHTGNSNRSHRQTIVSAIMVNLLNPKLSIFFLAFLPQFIRQDHGSVVVQMIMLSLAFMGITFAVFVLYGLFAAGMRDHIMGKPRVLTLMRRSFAAAFVALAAKLAVSQR